MNKKKRYEYRDEILSKLNNLARKNNLDIKKILKNEDYNIMYNDLRNIKFDEKRKTEELKALKKMKKLFKNINVKKIFKQNKFKSVKYKINTLCSMYE